MATERVLVVDDDARLRQMLQSYLTEQGFTVKVAGDAEAMDRILAHDHVDALVLDLMLPGEDGLSICKRLGHERPEIPVLILSARGDEVDRIIGLEIGADDYLSKPFHPRELVARLRAVLRRTQDAVPGAPASEAETVRFGGFTLDLGSRHLTRPDGTETALSSGEFSLLRALVTHPRQPLSRDRLMALSRGREHGAFDRSIDVQISRLRRLIEADPKAPRFIQTVWGVGYVFVPPDPEPAG